MGSLKQKHCFKDYIWISLVLNRFQFNFHDFTKTGKEPLLLILLLKHKQKVLENSCLESRRIKWHINKLTRFEPFRGNVQFYPIGYILRGQFDRTQKLYIRKSNGDVV